jgi:hypothetical protein
MVACRRYFQIAAASVMSQRGDRQPEFASDLDIVRGT